jgi:phospholipid/cholesterol/gamma-HCH transport system ATP-binding protein
MEKGMTEGGDGGTILRAENLAVGYGDIRILENLNFVIREGEILAVLGASGCGKTTLLRTLIGLLPPLEGRFWLAGEEVRSGQEENALARLHRHFGVMFQSDALIGSLSLEDNLSLPLEELTNLPREIISEMVRVKLDLVGLGPFAKLRPSELSGGMKKRAGLARAMALDAGILFCDEPTAGLDPPTALEVDRLLLELRKTLGITVVVVSHEISSIGNVADHCLMLDKDIKGIIAEGTLEELRRNEDSQVRNFFRRRINKPEREAAR